ncbi:hypothetical protein RFI_27159, partial [Reticulomyxa filosa]
MFKKMCKSSHNFRVLSYNCLAPIYCNEHAYPYVNSHVLNWDYRKYNITREILRYCPDIICLQEVQLNHFEEFFQKEFQEHNYEGIFRTKTRDSIREKRSIDGCAIFFNKNRYDVRSRYHVDFNETARQYLAQHFHLDPKNIPKDTQHPCRQMIRRLHKGNVALILLLTEKTNSAYDHPHELIVANTHMYWDPKFTDVKVWQTYMLCKELQKLRALGHNAPIVLCGDFNSEPSSAVYQILVQSKIDKTAYNVKLVSSRITIQIELIKEYGEQNIPSLEELQHELNFVSAYTNEPKYTNYTAHYKGTLDYVLYSKEKLSCLSHLEEVEETQLSKEMALPNSVHSSDHVPLMAEFGYNDDIKSFHNDLSNQHQQQQPLFQSNSPNNHISKRGNDDKLKMKAKPILSSQNTASAATAVVLNSKNPKDL